MSESLPKVKAIVFDCFGVLVSDSWLPFRKKHFDGDMEKFTKATLLRKQADGNKITRDEFYEQVSSMAGMTAEEMNKEIDSRSNFVNQEMLEYVSELKKDYKIGFLSNASQNWLGNFFTPAQEALFDKVSISCETGYVKPDPMAYQSIADMLDLPIEECLLIDDQPTYCEGAKALGMQVINYKDLDTLKDELAKRLN
jgi:HAD superfamily hydrolase (TIGR01509 family)